MGGQEMVRERLEDVVTRDLAQSLFSDAAISSEFVLSEVREQTHPQLVFVWDSLFCRSM